MAALEMPSGNEGKLGVVIYTLMNVPSAAKRSTVQCGHLLHPTEPPALLCSQESQLSFFL